MSDSGMTVARFLCREPIETRSSAGAAPRITGYAAVWDAESEPMMGGDVVEIVRRGAFTRSLAAGTDIRAFAHHDQARPIGRRSAGSLKIREDRHGLAVEITPPDTTAGRDVLEEVRSGEVTGFSFGFNPGDGTTRWTFSDGDAPDVRELLEVDLVEVSPVAIPAYAATEAELRSSWAVGSRRARLERQTARLLAM